MTLARIKDTMVIGYDTYHDTAQKGRSVGAVVASMNQTLTKWMSIANMHTNTSQELNDNLLPNMTKMLRRYNEVNGHLPGRIIMYRCVSVERIPRIQTLSLPSGTGSVTVRSPTSWSTRSRRSR